MGRKKAKANWKAIFSILGFAWMAGFILSVVLMSKTDGSETTFVEHIVVGTVMGFLIAGIVAVPVFLISAIIGSVQQGRFDAEAAFEDATTCTGCGRGDRRLEIINYEYCVFLVVYVYQRSITGKFCLECATNLMNKAFLANVFGCILFPPLILFSFLKKQLNLRKYRVNSGDEAAEQTP